MFNPKLTRGCFEERVASWASFVCQLFPLIVLSNEVRTWVEVPEEQELKLCDRGRFLPDIAINLPLCSSGGNSRSICFSAVEFFPGDRHSIAQVVFFLA